MAAILYLILGFGIGFAVGCLCLYIQHRKFASFRQRTLSMMEDMNATAQRLSASLKSSQPLNTIEKARLFESGRRSL